MNYTDDFLKALELIDLPKVALSHDELARLEQRVSAQIAEEQETATAALEIAPQALESSENALQMQQLELHSTKIASTRKKAPKVFPKALAGIAASLALVVCIGASVPTFAAEVPIVGDVFAWIYENTTGRGRLSSEQLNEYAQDVTITAEPSQDSDGTVSDLLTQSDLNPNPNPTAVPESAPVLASACVGDNIDVTITQVYCDGLYLRMSIVVTAEDDSLAQFESLGVGYGEKVYAATNLAGSAWIGGEEVYLQNGFSIFEKQDDNTFVGELAYRLETYVGFDVAYGTHAVSLAQDVSQPFTATIRLGGLLGYTGELAYSESSGVNEPEAMLLAESDVSFEVSVTPDDSQIRGTTVQTADNGIAVEQIFASPCATQITLSIPAELYEATVHTEMLLSTIDGEQIYPHEGVSGGDSEGFTFSMVFGAIPEDVSEVVVSLVNKNNAVTLVEFTCALSYEEGAALTAASSSSTASSASAVATPSVTGPTFLTDPYDSSEIDATPTDANTVITQGIQYTFHSTDLTAVRSVPDEMIERLSAMDYVTEDGTVIREALDDLLPDKDKTAVIVDITYTNLNDVPVSTMLNCVTIGFGNPVDPAYVASHDMQYASGVTSNERSSFLKTLEPGESFATTVCFIVDIIDWNNRDVCFYINPEGRYDPTENTRYVDVEFTVSE